MNKQIVKVKWFDNKRGYGFAVVPGQPDAFIHYKNIIGDGFKHLNTDQQIECRIVPSDRGLRAVDIKPL